MSDSKLEHDIKADISALINATELIRDEWRLNPELVERIIPLTTKKIEELQIKLNSYHIQKK